LFLGVESLLRFMKKNSPARSFVAPGSKVYKTKKRSSALYSLKEAEANRMTHAHEEHTHSPGKRKTAKRNLIKLSQRQRYYVAATLPSRSSSAIFLRFGLEEQLFNFHSYKGFLS